MGKGVPLKSQQLRSCVLILGMHASGTSALAGVFSKLGCDLPATALATKGNEANFESPAIRDFNDELLSSAGSSWDDFTSFHEEWMSSPPAAEFLDRAIALLEAEFGQSRLFVLNDQRICRLIPFWTEALNRFGCDVKPIISVRNPLEVSHSLLADENFSEPLGQMLWLRHLLDAEKSTRGKPRFVTGFEQLMQEWDAVVQKAGELLHLAWPKPAVNVEPDIERLLRGRRKQEAEAPTRALQNRLLPDWLRQTYEIMNGWAERGETADDYLKLDRLKAEFDMASGAFGRVVRAERDAASTGRPYESRARWQRGAPGAGRSGNGAADDEVTALKRSLQEQRRQATLMNAELHNVLESREAAEGELLEARTEIAASRARRKEMARVIANRDAKIAALNSELDARYRELATLERRFLRYSPVWLVRKFVRRINRLVRPPASGRASSGANLPA